MVVKFFDNKWEVEFVLCKIKDGKVKSGYMDCFLLEE